MTATIEETVTYMVRDTAGTTRIRGTTKEKAEQLAHFLSEEAIPTIGCEIEEVRYVSRTRRKIIARYKAKGPKP